MIILCWTELELHSRVSRLQLRAQQRSAHDAGQTSRIFIHYLFIAIFNEKYEYKFRLCNVHLMRFCVLQVLFKTIFFNEDTYFFPHFDGPSFFNVRSFSGPSHLAAWPYVKLSISFIQGVNHCAFSPDGTFFATCGNDAR